MRASGALVLVSLAVVVTGCATTGTQASTTGTVTTRCKDIDLSSVSLEPTPLASWDPKPGAQGFLHVHYSWPASGDGPVRGRNPVRDLREAERGLHRRSPAGISRRL